MSEVPLNDLLQAIPHAELTQFQSVMLLGYSLVRKSSTLRMVLGSSALAYRVDPGARDLFRNKWLITTGP